MFQSGGYYDKYEKLHTISVTETIAHVYPYLILPPKNMRLMQGTSKLC